MCGPCLSQDCGECVNCLDKPKFGGPNKKKGACIKRKCDNMTSSSKSFTAPSEAELRSLADIPVEVVGHSALASTEPSNQPQPVMSISLPVPGINDGTRIQDGSNKRRRIDSSHSQSQTEGMDNIQERSKKRRRIKSTPPLTPTEAVDNDDKSSGVDEGTSIIANPLHHDHCYSNSFPNSTSHLPIEEMSQDIPEAREDSGSDQECKTLQSKDISYDEDDLTCKEVMETEEGMDQRRLAECNPRKSESQLCKKEPNLDELLQSNDATSLLNAIDDDIEKLMEEEEELDNSDFDENEFDINDDQCDFSPVSVKKEKEVLETNTKIEDGTSKKTKSKLKVRIKTEPETPQS